MARFGSLDAQYFDDAGDPLISGKIYFYETGTTTLKNTYADVNLTIPNTNPVILTAAGRQPNIFFDGVAKAILTSSTNVQILVRDPVGETSSAFGDPWISSKTYIANDVVQGSDGQFYVALVGNNANQNPVTTTGYWTFLYSVEWNSGTTYKVGSVVTYQAIVYQSLQSSNLNQNPSTIAAYWIPIQLAWISTQTYALAANVIGTDGILYTSLQAGNINNQPQTSPTYWIMSTIPALKTVNSQSLIGSGNIVIGGTGTGATESSGSIVLTSASMALQSVTTTAYGQSVTLPSATTLTTGIPIFAIANRGAFPLLIIDNAGTLLGFVPVAGYVLCSVANIGTAAGVWDLAGEIAYAPDAGGSVTFGTAETAFTNLVAVTLDTTRVLFLMSGTAAVQSVVYDFSTGTFGTPALVRTGSIAAKVLAIKSATNQVLVVTCIATAMESVVLSISGTAITVNTALATTIAGTVGLVGDPAIGSTITQVGSSYVVPYAYGTITVIRSMTITGTTVAIGAELTLSGDKNYPAIMYAVGSVCVAFTRDGSIYVTPVTISGTTQTIGTLATIVANNNQFIVQAIGTRWALVHNGAGTKFSGSIVSLTGTTATASTVQLNAGTTGGGSFAMKINGSNIVCVSYDSATNAINANVMTDTAGTASAGTVATLAVGAAAYVAGFATDGIYIVAPSSVTAATIHKIGNSGAQPTTSTLRSYGISATEMLLPAVVQFGANLNTNNQNLISAQNTYAITSNANQFNIISGYADQPSARWELFTAVDQSASVRTALTESWICRHARGATVNRVFNFIRYRAA